MRANYFFPSEFSKNLWVKVAALVLLFLAVGFLGNRIVAVTMRLYRVAESTYAGNINSIFVLIGVIIIIFAVPFISRISNVGLLAMTAGLLPFFSRLGARFGIYAYTGYTGGDRLISGVALFIPLLFLYLTLRNRHLGQVGTGWRKIPASKAFWLFAGSGILMQFLFFPVGEAAKVSYYAYGVYLLWFLIILRYVNSMEDAKWVLVGLAIASAVSIALVGTAEQNVMSGSTLRMGSNTLGSYTKFGTVMASTLCFLPILFTQTKNRIIQILLLLLVFLCGRQLLLTHSRGPMISLIPIAGYVFWGGKSKKTMLLLAIFGVGLILFWQPIVSLFDMRPVYFSYSQWQSDSSFITRRIWLVNVFHQVFKFPYFISGFGVSAKGNLMPYSLLSSFNLTSPQGVHNGYVQIWAIGGILSLVGFLWLIASFTKSTLKSVRMGIPDRDKTFVIGLLLSILSWLFFFMTNAGNFVAGRIEGNMIFVTLIGLLVALTQKVGLLRTRP